MVIPPVFLFIYTPISWLLNPPEDPIADFTITFGIWAFITIICLCMELYFRINEVKFILTKTTFAVFFNNERYFRIAWKDIKRIQITKVSVEKPFLRGRRILSHKLIFLGSEFEKILKLWVFPIRKTNESSFLNSFKSYFRKMNIEIVEPTEIEVVVS